MTASAQSTLTPQKITAPIRDRGTYHLATGTWSRANASSSFNTNVLFNNTAPSGYVFGTSGTFNTVDHGRIPSLSSPTNATSVTGTNDVYTVVGFQLGYCSSIPAAAGGVEFGLTFYDNYGPCNDIDAAAVASLEVARFAATGLAGGTPGSAQGCWTSSFDLSNTTVTFALGGDADGTWENLANADSFGWALSFPGATAANGTGPFITGKCPAGGVAGNPVTPQHGFQTEFGGSPGATDATGLGTSDFFWIDAAGLVPNANGGCFFFGAMGNGCTDPSILGPLKNPFGSFWLQLFGSEGVCAPDFETRYCSTTVNSTGGSAVLSTAGSTDPNADLVFTSAPVPNTTGQFFYGPMMLGGLAMGLGDGFRCVGGMTTRLLPFVNAGMMMLPNETASFTVNYSAPYATGLTGTQHFQHWFREPAGMSITGSNTSDAISIAF